jgi:hypothetical protein
MSDQDRDDRAPTAADQIKLMAAREVISLIGCGVLLVMLHPGVQAWLQHQVWRIRQAAGRGQAAENAAVAELRRDISRYEHGEATL